MPLPLLTSLPFSKWPLDLLLSDSFHLNFHSILFTEEMVQMHVHSLLYCWQNFIFFDKSALSLSQHTSLLLKWKSLFINCISLEKHIFNSVILGIGRYFIVHEATPFLTPITSNVQLDSFDLSILNENPVVPQSSLAFYLEQLTKGDNLAAVVIMNGMTISLVGQNNNIIVMDSHLHGQLGAMVGIISVNKVDELLIFFKQQLSPHLNICSLTFVNY